MICRKRGAFPCAQTLSLLVTAIAVLLQGVLHAAEDAPRRIISLAPSLTREIYELREQDRLVGITSFCPRYVQGKEIIGSLTLLNFEKICSLRPDLILASTDSNKKNDIEKLKTLGMRVEIFSGCESFECMCRELVHLGRILGREKEAAAAAADARTRLAGLRSRIAGRPSLRVFWQVGANPLITASDQTFAGEMIRLAGCKNIFGALKGKYPRINVESVVTGNPDVIFIVGGMEDPKDLNAKWEPFGRISAVKNRRIYLLSADLVCQPTPSMFLEAFKTVAEHLYPEST